MLEILGCTVAKCCILGYMQNSNLCLFTFEWLSAANCYKDVNVDVDAHIESSEAV